MRNSSDKTAPRQKIFRNAHYLVIFFSVLLCGCGITRSIEYSAHDQTSQQHNMPVRQVAVVVLVPDDRHLTELGKIIDECSQLLFQQTGIRIFVKNYQTISWKSSDRAGMLQQVSDSMKAFSDPYDMAVAFAPMSFPQLLSFAAFGGWEGVIDDVYRRYIVLRTIDSNVLLHELVHGFLFSNTHTHGLMSATRICLVPGIACFHRSMDLDREDREEVMRKKWRNFSSEIHLRVVVDGIQ